MIEIESDCRYHLDMKKFNVLVINCTPEENLSFKEKLGLNDYMPFYVANRESALAWLLKNSCDLIFIDISANFEESLEICRMIKSNLSFQKIPVIFLMDGFDRTIIDNCFDIGCNDYILKPISSKELARKAMMHTELEFSRELSKDTRRILEQKIVERTIELEDSLLKLKKAKKELESLDIAKSEFLNLISHEIRTPLNGIMGSLTLIGRYHFTDEVNSYFSLLDASVKRLEKFSNSILEASNLRLKGEKMLILSTLNPVRIISEIIELCSVKYSDKVIQTSLKNKSKKLLIQADPKYLRKCLYAVIDNAFKFSPRGGTVSVSVRNDEKRFLDITVTDEGPGFSRDSIDGLYDALNNGHMHYDGNIGLGMHMARLIVEAHSGRISAGNIRPHGAKIKIELPVTEKKLSHTLYDQEN